MSHWTGCEAAYDGRGYCPCCGAVDPAGPIRERTLARSAAIAARVERERIAEPFGGDLDRAERVTAIVALRREGLTQAAIARRVGWSQPYVSKLLRERV